MKSTHSLTRVYGDHSHVERVELLSAIETELGRSGIVVVGAPYGYGKSTLLRDYARVLHAHAPSRPIVRVDLGLPAIRERIEREGRPGADRSASGPNGERTYRSTVAQIAWERACDEAPEWVRAVQTASVVTLGEADMPFMAIDDLPAMEEGELELFADAVRLWVRSGLQVVVASVPSASPAASQFSDVLHITSSMMSVSPDEIDRKSVV